MPLNNDEGEMTNDEGPTGGAFVIVWSLLVHCRALLGHSHHGHHGLAGRTGGAGAAGGGSGCHGAER
jgi:hypothetical protein